jgi:hypothetical protein
VRRRTVESGTEVDEAVRDQHSAEDLEAREGFERYQEEYMEERYPRYGFPAPGPSSDEIETESML